MKERRQRPRAAPEASCGLVPVAPQHGQPICGGGGAHLPSKAASLAAALATFIIAESSPADTLAAIAGAAEELTTELVQRLPAEWRGADVTAASLEGLRTRDDCKLLLAEITRAVPLRLLVEQGPRSLHRCEKEHLTPSHFFLSVPVEKLGAFVSHRWAADPRQTASAVTSHAVFHRGFIIWAPLSVFGMMFFLYYVWPPIAFLLIPALGPLLVAIVKAVRSARGLRLLGLHEPNLWFDKACVHQTRDCLTQCGLHLFEHYLDKSDRLMILFQPSCVRAPELPALVRPS